MGVGVYENARAYAYVHVYVRAEVSVCAHASESVYVGAFVYVRTYAYVYLCVAHASGGSIFSCKPFRHRRQSNGGSCLRMRVRMRVCTRGVCVCVHMRVCVFMCMRTRRFSWLCRCTCFDTGVCVLTRAYVYECA